MKPERIELEHKMEELTRLLNWSARQGNLAQLLFALRKRNLPPAPETPSPEHAMPEASVPASQIAKAAFLAVGKLGDRGRMP